MQRRKLRQMLFIRIGSKVDMKRKKLITYFLIGAAGLILAACGKVKGSSEKDIGRKTADEALEEKVQGIEGLETVFKEEKDIDGVTCYLYTSKMDGRELRQLLAVGAISGEVMVYDPDKNKVLGFDRFEYATEDEDAPASWDGEFYKSPYSLLLMPADDNSFEFELTKDGEDEPMVFGMAKVSEGKSKEAVCEKEGLALTFIYSKDGIEIKGTGKAAGVSGKYVLRE